MATSFAASPKRKSDLNAWELPGVKKTTLYIISLREIHERLAVVLGPMAAYVLAEVVNCLLDDGCNGDPWKRIEGTLRGQRFSSEDCTRIQVNAFGWLLTHLDDTFPGWSSHHEYGSMSWSMRGLRDLVLVVHPELPRQKHVRHR